MNGRTNRKNKAENVSKPKALLKPAEFECAGFVF